jgi:NAD(P)-dependent dehydrogenase (short-subunit alcohol dehydrogenase family)
LKENWVVTGGNSGIGLATAQRFVENSAQVFITVRRQSEFGAGVNTQNHTQQALRLFQDDGSIILTASITASKGTKAFSVYSATKATINK